MVELLTQYLMFEGSSPATGSTEKKKVPKFVKFFLENESKYSFFWFKWVLDRGPEQRESKMTVLCLLITIILIN